jgi:hypothetical protein
MKITNTEALTFHVGLSGENPKVSTLTFKGKDFLYEVE